jgi:hypothetical protein
MATKKDVDAAMQVQEKNGLEIANEMAQIARQNATEIKDDYIIYKLVDTSRKGRVYIDGIDDNVLNPKTGNRERIWFLSGSSSIWSTELVEMLKDKDWLRMNRRSLQFEGGVLRVQRSDERQIEFINACRHFIDNPSRRSGSKHEFFEYNPAKQQQAALEKEMLEMEMAILASQMEISKVRKLASFFGIIFFDELGQPKTDDGIRRELMLFAKRSPKKFQENIDSKEVEIAFYIRKAIIDAKIDLGGVGGNISWANGGRIAKMPMTRKAQEFLTELAMTNSDEGKAFLEQLERVSK